MAITYIESCLLAGQYPAGIATDDTYLYVSSGITAKLHRIAVSTFTEVNSCLLSLSNPRSAAMDDDDVFIVGYEAVGGMVIGKFSKVDKSSLTESDTLLLAHGEYYLTGDDSQVSLFGVNWFSQSFTPQHAHYLTHVYIKLKRVGSPGDITVDVKAVDGSGHPTGSALCSGTIGEASVSTTSYNLESAIITVPIDLTGGTQYALVISAPAGDASNYYRLRIDTSGVYSGGEALSSGDSGGSWAVLSGQDFIFKCYDSARINANSLLIVGSHLYAVTSGGVVKIQKSTMTVTAFLNLYDTVGASNLQGCYRIASDGDFIYVGGADGKVYKIDLAPFTLADEAQVLAGYQVDSCGVLNDFLLVALTYGNSSKLYKLSKSNLEVLSFILPNTGDYTLRDILVIGDYVFFCVSDGAVSIYQIDSGFTVIDTAVGGDTEAQQLVSIGGNIYATQGGSLVGKYMFSNIYPTGFYSQTDRVASLVRRYDRQQGLYRMEATIGAVQPATPEAPFIGVR